MIRSSKKIDLFEHQKAAVNQLKTGSILCGGVGSGKSLTAILYYYTKECGGKFDRSVKEKMKDPKDLYIITTAKKRDSLDWDRECAIFALSKDRDSSINGVQVTVDSWNNIKKYTEVKDAFFIFDEQRLVGSGVWVKSFLAISKRNPWILLTATPGDSWMDYVPVFIANRFYKNRTEFIRRHVVYNSFTKFPKIDRYVETGRLERLKRNITVTMDYVRPTTIKRKDLYADFDKEKFKTISVKRWNPFTDKPIKDITELLFTMRKVVNADPSRFVILEELLEKHRKLIIFYNFNYELDILRKFQDKPYVQVAEYNGHKHEPIPEGEKWVYLVQYISGGEGWNCTETNVIVFYSQNYSYRMMTQAAGRIDRLNTPFATLYYYHILSTSVIDRAIAKALKNKKKFNERTFALALKTDAIIEGE
jgi:hypothetical protein